MKPLPIPVYAIGPGSQPPEAEPLNILPLPSGMSTFRMPVVPESADRQAVARARDVLADLLARLEAWDGVDGAHPRLDVTTLEAAARSATSPKRSTCSIAASSAAAASPGAAPRVCARTSWAPSASNRIARFRLDPRDAPTDDDFYELIGDDGGVFGCMSLLACHDACPKNLPLQTQLAFIRRKMVRMAWK